MSGVMPALSYIAFSSAFDLNLPSASRLSVHSMWIEPGIAPPRAARTMRAEVFAFAAGVENGDVLFVRASCSTSSTVAKTSRRSAILNVAALGAVAFGCHRRARGFPGLHAAVEHFHVRVAVVFQEPHAARRAHIGVLFVENDFFRFADAAQFEHMVDHEHKRFERRVGGVDQTQAEEIEMGGAGNMALGVVFGRSGVDDAEIGGAEFASAIPATVVSNVSRVYCFSIGSL